MAFSLGTLMRLGPQNSNGPVLWMYASADAKATVDGSGYFNGAADRLQVGDVVIMVVGSATDGGIALVNANTRDLAANPPVAGVVDITNFVALGAIDSD